MKDLRVADGPKIEPYLGRGHRSQRQKRRQQPDWVDETHPRVHFTYSEVLVRTNKYQPYSSFSAEPPIGFLVAPHF
jgi:hypothetical protein